MRIENGKLDLPKELYHQDTTHVSHSALEVFRESVPLFHGRYVAKTIAPRKATDDMEFGTAFHTLLLEPDKFDSEVAVAPEKWNRRTNQGKDDEAAFRAANPGKIVLRQEDMESLLAMREAALAAPAARGILGIAGEAEFTLQWIDRHTEIACKARFDKWSWLHTEHVIIDLKTAEDPTPAAFARSCLNYGYHRQDHWYRWGASEALAIDRPRFLFVVVGKNPPHETVVYELSQKSRDLAALQVADDMRRLHDCRLFDSWQSRWAEEVQTLELPRYAFTE